MAVSCRALRILRRVAAFVVAGRHLLGLNGVRVFGNGAPAVDGKVEKFLLRDHPEASH